MSDTPRTDEAYWRTDKGCNTCVPADFARDLERENARLREALHSVLPILDGMHDGSQQYEDIRAYEADKIRALLKGKP